MPGKKERIWTGKKEEIRTVTKKMDKDRNEKNGKGQ